MKKIILSIIILLNSITFIYAEENNTLDLSPKAKSAIIIEASTGEVLYEKNSKNEYPMASMTKMMSLLLIMENIESGNLKWDEMITASANASSMGGSQIFLQTGEKMSVEDMIKGICIASGNDATVAMAERIGGTEENFVSMMNDKLKELGLTNTHFDNSYGFDSDTHYSSAYDMAMIAKELIKYEKILEYSSTYEDYLRKNTANSFWLVNTNKLVRYYSGVDGLKTGYTDNAGYCLTSTAKKNNMRLITVVMGEPDSTTRSSETVSMLDYGFNNYKIDTILSKKDILDKIKVNFGNKEYVEVVPSKDINILKSKQSNNSNIEYKISLDKVNAPINTTDKVGNIEVYEDNKIIMNIDINTVENIKKINIFSSYLRELKSILTGII